MRRDIKRQWHVRGHVMHDAILAPPEQGKNRDSHPTVRRDNGKRSTRRVRREISRADDALAGLKRGDDVGFLIDMIAKRDDIDAITAELMKEVLSDPAAAGDVLTV